VTQPEVAGVAYTHLADAIPCQTHRGYRLNCEQYESLRTESAGGCQICGFPAEEMPQRKLYIDHRGANPSWHVRGLLCISCNSRLGRGIPFNGASTAYLENAWFLRQCAALGVPLDGGPEPDAVELVDIFNGRHWARKGEQWYPSDNRTFPRTWRRLCSDYGPFNFRAVW
jgi:hypothetical protein